MSNEGEIVANVRLELLCVQCHLYIVLNWVFCGQLVTYLSLNAVFQNVTYPSTSFTDLAEIVSRIEPVKAAVADDESDYQTEYEEEVLDNQKDDYIHFIGNQAEDDSDSDEDVQIRKRKNLPKVDCQASSTGEPA